MEHEKETMDCQECTELEIDGIREEHILKWHHDAMRRKVF